MTRYEEYDERDLADIIFDEIPYVKEAFEEHIRDREEVNDDEEFYRFHGREQGYDF